MGGEPLDSDRSTRRDGGRVRGPGGGAYPTPRAMATPAVRSMMLGDRRVCIGAPRCCRERAFVSDVASAKRRVSSRRKIQSGFLRGAEREKKVDEGGGDRHTCERDAPEESERRIRVHSRIDHRPAGAVDKTAKARVSSHGAGDRSRPQGSTEKTSVGSILR